MAELRHFATAHAVVDDALARVLSGDPGGFREFGLSTALQGPAPTLRAQPGDRDNQRYLDGPCETPVDRKWKARELGMLGPGGSRSAQKSTDPNRKQAMDAAAASAALR